ncbi:hypothetical protein QMO17_33070, partial [Klebsiella pneumoniae]|nr:hypothetical protein [Klebsiella pneumoniae]
IGSTVDCFAQALKGRAMALLLRPHRRAIGEPSHHILRAVQMLDCTDKSRFAAVDLRLIGLRARKAEFYPRTPVVVKLVAVVRNAKS